ncbi:flagellar basal body-associated FliL family protein [Nocardioides euryhalodurans]|uniref:Flagellar protein FliL n=1 Tax=Nocardioides euryhalodurans TaxID=2518370 RepID=A0A4P7GL20_9ACTN|nr:flagellar basal body-associated FliL family protein [Nocardioides euryhalodurans]QBR92381.1 flagellar basal body-associated FliL family protein [Nocardioides euryhalodurans]
MSTTTAPAQVDPNQEPDEEGGRSRRTLVLGLVVVLVLGAAAGWWFLLRPTEPVEPLPGEVITLEPIQINLAEGHYLRVGLALQLTEEAHEVDGSKALDAAISLFSGVDMSELAQPVQRDEFKHKLQERLHDGYHGDVMEVYFTEFVTQ